jgi:hypothetical protein
MAKITVCCPSCNWKPDNKAHWKCTCGTQWNAFESLGKCPTCSKQWAYTQCVEEVGGCNHFAPIEEWYQGLNEVVNDLIEEMSLKTKSSLT